MAGSFGEPQDLITIDNFLVTPNGVGNNDSLIIPELEQLLNSTVQIFDC